MKPKVLWIPRWYPNRLNDQDGNFIENHARAVSEYADLIILYVGGDPESQRTKTETQHTTEYGFEVYRIYYNSRGLNHLPGRLIKLLRYWQACWHGWKLIRQEHGLPDICHLHILTRTSLLAFWMHARHRIPYLISEHSGFFLNDHPGWNERIKFFRKFICKKALFITVVSSHLMQGMQKFGLKGNYVIIPNTVFFQTGIANVKNKRPLKITTIGCNAEQYKNVSGIIRAYASVCDQLPDTILQIIGYGTARKMLERLAAESGLLDKKIFFPGKIDNEKVYSLLSESAFVVVNSNSESFSMTAAESLASGTAVLCTKCGGPEEFLDETNSRLIELRNEQQLKEGLIWMSEHFDEFSSEGMREAAFKRFSPERIGKQFFALYQSALGERQEGSSA